MKPRLHARYTFYNKVLCYPMCRHTLAPLVLLLSTGSTGADFFSSMVKAMEVTEDKNLPLGPTRTVQGLLVSTLNQAQTLEGVQVGLINVARNTPEWARVLPILNVNL